MTGESVEPAALHRGDVQGRAEREAAAILDECGVAIGPRSTLVTLLAIAWLQGNICGSHETLGHAERAFDRMRESL